MPKETTDQDQKSQRSRPIGAEPMPSDMQFEQIAKDQQDLQRMLDSITDLDNTHSEELANVWQSITDRGNAVRKQHDSLDAYRSQVEGDAESVKQRQRELETQQQELDAREQALDTRDTHLGQTGDTLDHSTQQSRLAAWEAKLNSLKRQLHDRHATLDRDARYATLQKSNLRAERDELAILREQLQMASGNV
ncbi:MAG: hypothetical protein ABGZ17_07055, partial [Planctomycetaceae bacterium]